MKNFLILSIVLVAILSNVGIVVAGNQAQEEGARFPGNAIEIAPGVFHLGMAMDNGEIIEGYAFVHYEKSAKSSKPSGDEYVDIYKFMFGGIKWNDTVQYEVNSFGSGLVEADVLEVLGESLVSDIEKGDRINLSQLSLGSHTGTHMDAPLHFLRDGKGLDKIPLTALVGPARVIAIQDPVSVKPDELIPHQIERGERILFKTHNSDQNRTTMSFLEDFVFLSTDAAHFLAERKVRIVGVDYLSVGGYKKNGYEVHRALLKAGIWIIEGLDLSQVQTGRYELICLPIKIAG